MRIDLRQRKRYRKQRTWVHKQSIWYRNQRKSAFFLLILSIILYYLISHQSNNPSELSNNHYHLTNHAKLLYYRSFLTNPKFDTNVPNYRCINIYLPSRSNGLGIDAEIYHQGFNSSEIIKAFIPPTSETIEAIQSSKADIYLEQTPELGVFYKFYPSKTQFWWMPNAEWSNDEQFHKVNFIIAKTKFVLYQLIKYRREHHLSYIIYYTKHTTTDIYRPNIKKNYKEFFHASGTSWLKNTELILDCWSQHPEWPKLTVLAQDPRSIDHYIELLQLHKKQKFANINFQTKQLPYEELIQLQNQIGIHLCPSAIEGYGHYINEARSAKSLIITGNIQPTNELINSSMGFLLGKPHPQHHQGILKAEWLDVKQEELEAIIQHILTLSVKEIKRMGELARKAYLEEREYLLNSLKAINDLICEEKDSLDFLNYVY